MSLDSGMQKEDKNHQTLQDHLNAAARSPTSRVWSYPITMTSCKHTRTPLHKIGNADTYQTTTVNIYQTFIRIALQMEPLALLTYQHPMSLLN
jgi:hypothetical protein